MSRIAVANQRCFCSEFRQRSTLPVRFPISEFRFSMQLVVLKERPNSVNTPKRWRVSVSSKPSSRLATAD